MTLDTFKPGALDGYEFYYFKLHGLAGQPYWYGDNWVTALSADQVREARMDGAVVFVANCYLPDSPMLAALLSNGARAVIGGAGQNYARSNTVDGADLLGLWVRRGLQFGLSVEKALQLGKSRMGFKAKKSQSRTDTLAFKLWMPKKHGG